MEGRPVPGDRASRVEAILAGSAELQRRVAATESATVVEMADRIARSLVAGGKLLLCGNGGSAADAQHLAAELLVRLRPEVERPGLPALALALDSSTLTAHANDLGFEGYYARMVETLGGVGDVLLGISTSGRSRNVVLALLAARAKGIVTLGLLGGDGGDALAACDLAVVVPSATTARVQEVHIALGHVLLELVEDELVGTAG